MIILKTFSFSCHNPYSQRALCHAFELFKSMTLSCIDSYTHWLSVSSLINIAEGSVSREKRKRYPPAFLGCRLWVVQQNMICVVFFDQGQCALFDFIERTIVLLSVSVRTTWSYIPIVSIWHFRHTLKGHKEKTNLRSVCCKYTRQEARMRRCTLRCREREWAAQ